MSGSAEAAINANLALLVDAERARTRRGDGVRRGRARTSPIGELDDGAARFAGLLAARGVRAGDRVALLLPNIPAFAEAYYGALRLGAIVVPLNMLLVEPEIVEPPRALGLVGPGRGARSRVRRGAEHRSGRGRGPQTHASTWRQVDGGDTAVLLYTSGTTGHPKAAELSHAGLALDRDAARRRCSASARTTSSSAPRRSRTSSGSPAC